MPTRGSALDLLVDTSVAVALLVVDHPEHASATDRVARRRAGLAGHAAFETYSVLTRLPPPRRRPPAVVADLIAERFPANRYLSPDTASQLVPRLVAAGVAGGNVYDALVGAVAAQHGLPLATLDRRALDTYRALGVDVEFLG